MTRSRLANTNTDQISFYRQRGASARAASSPSSRALAVPARASSRLQTTSNRRQDEKSACRYLRLQILIIMLLIAASGIIYLVFVFPFLVQWTGQLNSQKYVAPDRSIRPQMPLLNAPPTYTSDDQLSLTGFATPSTQVQFIVNGSTSKDDLIAVSLNGEFAHTIYLEEGENTIQAYSFDANGLESAETKVFTVILDTQEPVIDLESPENHQEFNGRAQQIMLIQGHTEPGARIVVNSSATRADVDGFFELEYHLQEGTNNLEIVATDNAENESKITIAVTFHP